MAIGSSVTRIGFNAFYNCASLTNVTIPNSVTSIGNYSFSSCTSLTSVEIPNSVTSIGVAPFATCTGLTNISVDAANSIYSSFGGVLLNKARTTLIQFPGGRDGNYAIPNTVANIGESAFAGCRSLANMTIPNSVISIENSAFAGCTSLTSVTIPNSVTSIWFEAFYNCTSLTNNLVDSANAAYSSLDGVLLNKARTTLIQFPGGRGGSYAIPNSVTRIAHAAFSYCTSLTSVTIPNSVSSIGFQAFYFRTNLTGVTVLGNPPSEGLAIFDNVAPDANVYYYYGATGWGQEYGGLPATMLGAPAPQLIPASAGVKPGDFGFTLDGVVNQTVVVEASVDLLNWQLIRINTLSTSSTNFVDPQWANFPRRFYRLRSN